MFSIFNQISKFKSISSLYSPLNGVKKALCALTFVLLTSAPLHALYGALPLSQGDPAIGNAVALVSTTNGFYCSGSIVSERVILTAAHCIEDPSIDFVIYFAKPGELISDFSLLEKSRIRIPSDYAIPPDRANIVWARPVPKYDLLRNLTNDDIGLVSFSGGLPKDSNVRFKSIDLLTSPLKLAEWGSNKPPYQNATVAGFGKNEKSLEGFLQTGLLDLVATQTSESSKSYLVAQKIAKTQVCKGDSGGPLYVKDPKNGWQIVGVVARTASGLDSKKYDDMCESKYSLFTSVSHYLEWIKFKLADLE